MTLKSLTIFAAFVAGLTCAGTGSMAQDGVFSVPVNFPPSSFKGKQFVDNSGCVFVRAGFDGAVNWVPRVSRQRKQVCGQKPTFGTTTAAAPASKPAPEVVQIEPPAQTPKKPAATAAAKPAAPAQTRTRVATQPSPAPKPTVVAGPKPATQPVSTARATPRWNATKPSPAPEPTIYGATKPAATTAPAPQSTRTKRRTATYTPSPAPEPTIIPGPKPAATAPTRTRKTRRTAAYTPSPAPAPTIIPGPQQSSSSSATVRTPASKPIAAQPPRVVRAVPQSQQQTTARRVQTPTYTACSNGTYTRTIDGTSVIQKCAPQPSSHVTIIRRGEAPGPGKKVYYNNGWQGGSLDLPADTRIVPRHVYERLDLQQARIPEGYRPAWEDDRLNVRRAAQTVGGHWETQQVWTNTVPRRLVSTVNDHKVKPPRIAYRTTVAQKRAESTRPVISTRSAPSADVDKALAAPRYVEIGVFTSETKAKDAARRLQSAGLPVKFSTFSRNGSTLRRVLVGPYSSSANVTAALGSVKKVGYSQAYIR